MTCPLLYRFRVIDRIPEPPTPATARGTLVHAVLERLFDRPAASRTPAAAREMLVPEWERLAEADPDLGALFSDDSERSVWLREASAALDGYFTLEDPRRLEPAEREWYVETELDSGLRLRGYIDRLDMTPAGDIRIVDYKTGKVPREAYEASALFQMKFYALVIWRVRGVIPRMLQLMYVADGELLRYSPDEAYLRATQRKLEALWQAIERARANGDWRARPGKLCDWCRHKSLCPEFGGTPPPLPATPGVAAAPTMAVPGVTAEPTAAEPAVAAEPVPQQPRWRRKKHIIAELQVELAATREELEEHRRALANLATQLSRETEAAQRNAERLEQRIRELEAERDGLLELVAEERQGFEKTLDDLGGGLGRRGDELAQLERDLEALIAR